MRRRYPALAVALLAAIGVLAIGSLRPAGEHRPKGLDGRETVASAPEAPRSSPTHSDPGSGPPVPDHAPAEEVEWGPENHWGFDLGPGVYVEGLLQDGPEWFNTCRAGTYRRRQADQARLETVLARGNLPPEMVDPARKALMFDRSLNEQWWARLCVATISG